MKKSQLRQIINEAIQSLNEEDSILHSRLKDVVDELESMIESEAKQRPEYKTYDVYTLEAVYEMFSPLVNS